MSSNLYKWHVSFHTDSIVWKEKWTLGKLTSNNISEHLIKIEYKWRIEMRDVMHTYIP